MSEVREDRDKQIEELDSFIQITRKRLEDVVLGLGWTMESISNESQTIVTCPFNKHHRIQGKSLEHHLEKCQWKAEGYEEWELPLSEPCPSVDSLSSIKFDEQLQDDVLMKAREKDPTMHTEISLNCRWNVLNISFFTIAAGVADRLIPRTTDRLMASFTSDERKAIYDYVIENTIKPDLGDDIADMNKTSEKDGNNPKTSLLELLAQERNLKRRRAKHRGVHTNKKSQVEILREVINQQMEMYEEYLADSKVKCEPKSPSKSEAGSLDYRACDEGRDHGRNSSRSESKYFDRVSNVQNFLPPKRSPKRDFRHERERKRNTSGSGESVRAEHRSKHKRDRSKDRSRHERGSGRHRSREEKSLARDEVSQSEDRNEQRKRHRPRDKKNKHRERSRRRDKSDDYYSQGRRE